MNDSADHIGGPIEATLMRSSRSTRRCAPPMQIAGPIEADESVAAISDDSDQRPQWEQP